MTPNLDKSVVMGGSQTIYLLSHVKIKCLKKLFSFTLNYRFSCNL